MAKYGKGHGRNGRVGAAMAPNSFWLVFAAVCGLTGAAYYALEQARHRREITLLTFIVGLFLLLAVNYQMSRQLPLGH
jgi:hypothetical protein